MSPSFKGCTMNTKVNPQTALGPLPLATVFHGSNRRFECLDGEDCLGMHFGTADAASARLKSVGHSAAVLHSVESDDGDWMVEEEVYAGEAPTMHGPFDDEQAAQAFVDAYESPRKPDAFSLTLKAPLMLTDLGQWTFNGVFRHLSDIGFLQDAGERDVIWEAWQRSDAQGWQALRAALQGRGFDSIAYVNEVEDAGSVSWIAFENDQVKPLGVVPAPSPDTLGHQLWERLQADSIEDVLAWLRRDHPDLITRINRLTETDEEYRLDQLANVVPPEELRKLPPMEHSTTIWRGLPLGAQIRPGDWVSLTPEYAGQHGDRTLERPHVESLPLVQVTDLFWAGTDINEFFYLPQAWRKEGASHEQYLRGLSREMVLALADGEMAPIARHREAIERIERVVVAGARAHDYHGPDHWKRVMHHALATSRSLGISPLVPYVFGLVHDSQREDDGMDPEHGPRAAKFVERHRHGLFSFLDNEQVAHLVQACDQHSDGWTDGPPHVIAAWDGDRLDLGRVSMCPDPKYLCTAYARQAGVIRQALRLSGADYLVWQVEDEDTDGGAYQSEDGERFRA